MTTGRPNSLEILRNLVAFPTLCRESNVELIRYIEAYLTRLGVESATIWSEDGTRANLHCSIGPQHEPGILLSGHTDVVPVAGQSWSGDPFALRVEGTRAIARGAVDMKGFLACMLGIASLAADRKLSRPLHLAFSYDEEVGCVGVRRMLPALAALPRPPSVCIIGEPTEMRLVLGHKGKVMGRVLCRGVAGHSSERDAGVNAILLASDMLAAIERVQDDLRSSSSADESFKVPFTTVHVGRIAGGTSLNVIPSECEIDFEIRNIPADDPNVVLRRLRDRALAVADRHRDGHGSVAVEIEITNAYPTLMCPPDVPVVAELQRTLGSPRGRNVSFGTEAGLFAQALGVPCVVCGPGAVEQAHKPDEYIELSELAACDAFLARLLDQISASDSAANRKAIE
jgi:acetylornithine deacetylase